MIDTEMTHVEGTMSIDDLWNNFSHQYAEKRQEYELEKSKIEDFDMTTSRMGKIDLERLNDLRTDCVKLEGCLESIILVRKYVFGLELTDGNEES